MYRVISGRIIRSCKLWNSEFRRGRVVDIIEKPSESDATSNLALCGRYLLPEWTLDVLRRYPVSEYGELQSIYALRHMIKNGGLNGVVYNTSMSMYDSGNPVVWLKSQIHHALQRDDLRESLRNWLFDELVMEK